MRPKVIAAALAAAVAGAAAAYLASGQRYKLYVDPVAARCWAAVQEVTFSPRATRFVRLRGPERVDRWVTATIEFESRNFFGGSIDSTATCEFDLADPSQGRRAARLVVNGQELAEDVLEAVNAGLESRP